MKINIITPTVGRPSLTRTIASARDQLRPGDDHWILPDCKAMGCTPEEASIRVQRLTPAAPNTTYGSYGRPLKELESDGPGNGQRNFALDALRERPGEWVMFLDDDDVLERTALQRIRIYLHGEPPRCQLFPMLDPGRKLLHNYGIIARGGIGGSQILCPTGPQLPRWGPGYAGDFDFIIAAIKQFGYDGHWGEPPIVIMRPPGTEAVLDHSEFPLLDYHEHRLAGKSGLGYAPGEITE